MELSGIATHNSLICRLSWFVFHFLRLRLTLAEAEPQETMTGKVPYHDKHDIAVQFAVGILKEHPARPEDCIPTKSLSGDKLWSFLLQCWSPKGADRPTAAKVQETVVV
jgi:hypothetical protein